MTTGGYSPPSPFSGAALFDPKILASLPPLDRPVAIVHGSGPVPAPPAPVPRPAPVPTDLDRTRRALARRLIELASTPAVPASPSTPASAASVSASASVDGPVRESDSDVVPPDGLDPGSRDLWSAVAELLRPDGSPLPVDSVDECVALATTVVAEPVAADPVTAGTDRLLLAVSLLLRGRHDDGGWGDHDGWGVDDGWGDDGGWGDESDTDLAAGAEHLLAAIELLPPEHPAAATACLGVGAFLDERHPWRGPLGRMTAQVAQRAEAVLSAGSASEEQAAVVRAVAAWCRLTVIRREAATDPTYAGAATAPTDAGHLLAAVAAVPADDPWRPRLAAAAGLAGVAAGLAQGSVTTLRDASWLIGSVSATVESMPAVVPDRRTALPGQMGALAAALGALADGDRVVLRSAVDRLAADGSAADPDAAPDAAPDTGPDTGPDTDPADAVRLDAVLGALRLALAEPGDLAPAIDSLARATVALTSETDETLRTASWWRLVEAYRRAGTPGDLRRARLAAIRALRDGAREVDGPSRYASWMLAGGGALEAFEALEAAAAIGADPIDPLVRDVAVILLHLAGIDVAAADERSRAVGPPSVAEVVRALHEIGAAALVYLHPVDEGPGHAGVLLLDAATERLDLIGRVRVPDLTAGPSAGWDDEAWSELVEPLLTLLPAGPGPRRVLVAATGPLAGSPLAAIPERLDRSGRYAGTGLIISEVASGRQVVELARRRPLPVTGNAVFVANPRGDREAASYEVMLLRRLFHGDSIGLGQTVERVHGRGTPAEVLAHLPGPAGPGAGLLHLGCGVRTTEPPALALARPEADGGDATGSDWLDIDQIRAQASAAGDVTAGGLAILPPDAAAGGSWVRFAHDLLRAGLTGVIGWRWPVPGQVAALMLFVLHGKLADEGLPPADAVHEVHRWMLDPARPAPRDLPTGYAAALQGRDLTDPVYWSSLCHFGR